MAAVAGRSRSMVVVVVGIKEADASTSLIVIVRIDRANSAQTVETAAGAHIRAIRGRL